MEEFILIKIISNETLNFTCFINNNRDNQNGNQDKKSVALFMMNKIFKVDKDKDVQMITNKTLEPSTLTNNRVCTYRKNTVQLRLINLRKKLKAARTSFRKDSN